MILGTAGQVFNAGEIKFFGRHRHPDAPRWQEVSNICICGQDAAGCPFWREVIRLGPDLEAFYAQGAKGYLNLILQIARLYSPPEFDDTSILRHILLCAQQIKPDVTTILDMSKNLPRLHQLLRQESLETSILFLIREPYGYVNSYRKRHRKGFLRWVLQWILVNVSCKAYLHLRGLRHHIVSYENLITTPQEELARIEDFLAIRLPENYLEESRKQESHVRAGNPAMIRSQALTGLILDDSWKTELSFFQVWIIRALTFPFGFLTRG
jgi:hypothetical protein